MLHISRALVDEMIAHARRHAPDECWGVLGGSVDTVLGVFPCENAARPEERPFRFDIEPRSYAAAEDAITERGWQVAGIYHSHTHTQPFPSPTDFDNAAQMGPWFGDIVYMFVSLRAPRQPFVYRGMPHDAWQRAHDFAQTQPADPEVAAYRIRDGTAEQLALNIAPAQG